MQRAKTQLEFVEKKLEVTEKSYKDLKTIYQSVIQEKDQLLIQTGLLKEESDQNATKIRDLEHLNNQLKFKIRSDSKSEEGNSLQPTSKEPKAQKTKTKKQKKRRQTLAPSDKNRVSKGKVIKVR